MIDNKNTRGRGYWKFPKFLLADANFRSELVECIKQTVIDNEGTEPGLLWDTVKNSIRGFTIEYLSREKRQRKEKIEVLENQIAHHTLQRDQRAFEGDPYKAAFHTDQVDKLQNKLDKVYEELNNAAFKFKAAQVYYESNRCTKFYFRSRVYCNDSIKCLENSKGERITSQKGILEECRSYYEALYTQPRVTDNPMLKQKFLNKIPRNALSEEGSALLGKEITMEELHEAIKGMKRDSVPGEDGLIVDFYLTFWNVVKDLLFSSLQYAFEVQHMSITQRRGMIRLLPKENRNPLLVSSWRPITLLNVDYKAITKLFAKRLSLFLPDLIHPDQKGFIKHRTIHENLLDVQAVMTACETEDTEAMLLLLDIQKAFDSIGWDFLRSVLLQYGFPGYFVTWFEIFYTGKELHVLNNGHMSEVIFPSRGISQGCSISPLYFILALETLALAIRDNPKIVGMSVLGKNKKVSFLADDGLLVLKWTQQTFNELLQVLKEFGEVSNLQVNKHKSTIVTIGPRRNERDRLVGSEFFPSAPDGRFHYLGIDWDVKRHSCPELVNFKREMASIKKQVMERNNFSHTMIGRVLNVKSLFASKLIYKLQSIPSPATEWLNGLQSILNQYIWSFGRHYVKASQLYLPVAEGGLNMLNLSLYEKALKFNWLHKAANGFNSFWAIQLQSCLKVPLVELLCYNIKSTHLAWVCCKELPPIWELTLKHWCDIHYTKTEGNVALMPVKYNSALTSKSFRSVFNEDFIDLYHAHGVHTVSDFLDIYDSWTKVELKTFKACLVMKCISNEWLTQNDSASFGEVSSLELSLNRPASVKQFYSLLLTLQTPVVNKAALKWEEDFPGLAVSDNWSTICRIQNQLVQVKLRMFYYRFINRAFTMNVKKIRFENFKGTIDCSFCKDTEETFVHIFWDCPRVSHLWSSLITWCKTNVCKDATYSKENCLIMGFNKPVLNRIVTVAKYRIHVLRLFGGDFSFETLLARIQGDKASTLNAYSQLPYLSATRGRELWSPLA